jgi:hypothetical protein
MQEKLRGQFSSLDNVLQKAFPENDKWGASILFANSGQAIDLIEICTLSEVTPNKAKWTHYAQIIAMANGEWEVSRRFMGDNEDEMWIYGTFKIFSDAVDFVCSQINNALPKAKY